MVVLFCVVEISANLSWNATGGFHCRILLGKKLKNSQDSLRSQFWGIISWSSKVRSLGAMRQVGVRHKLSRMQQATAEVPEEASGCLPRVSNIVTCRKIAKIWLKLRLVVFVQKKSQV